MVTIVDNLIPDNLKNYCEEFGITLPNIKIGDEIEVVHIFSLLSEGLKTHPHKVVDITYNEDPYHRETPLEEPLPLMWATIEYSLVGDEEECQYAEEFADWHYNNGNSYWETDL